MTSLDKELKNISAEMRNVSLRRQQLLERKKILCISQELRKRAEFAQTEEAASNQQEIDNIEHKLKQLVEKKVELQKSYDDLSTKGITAGDTKSEKEVSFTSSVKKEPVGPVSDTNIFYVEAPPTIPAPSVILDVEKLPQCPCRTQCPECQQFVMTETYTSVSSVTWLVCLMTALLGCVAGCCLLPFCLDRFKSVTHRCPRCRASIQTIKKL